MVTIILKRMVIIMKKERQIVNLALINASRIEQKLVHNEMWEISDKELYAPANLFRLTATDKKQVLKKICAYLDLAGAQIKTIDGKKYYYYPPRGASVNVNGEAF